MKNANVVCNECSYYKHEHLQVNASDGRELILCPTATFRDPWNGPRPSPARFYGDAQSINQNGDKNQ